MECVNGSLRPETTLVRIERESRGRYSIRWPLESRLACAARRASGVMDFDSRMGKSDSIFAICSPFESHYARSSIKVKRLFVVDPRRHASILDDLP